MQRIIEGKAYNTATALHVAHAEEYEWQDEGTTRVTTRYDLYRTQGGAFFLTIEEEILTGIGLTRQTDPVIGVELHPLGYDEAHSFARGDVQIGRLRQADRSARAGHLPDRRRGGGPVGPAVRPWRRLTPRRLNAGGGRPRGRPLCFAGTPTRAAAS
jgi:hypothetical protein